MQSKMTNVFRISKSNELLPISKLQFLETYISSIILYAGEAYCLFIKKFRNSILPIYFKALKQALGVDKYCSNYKILMITGKLLPELRIKMAFLKSTGILA